MDFPMFIENCIILCFCVHMINFLIRDQVGADGKFPKLAHCVNCYFDMPQTMKFFFFISSLLLAIKPGCANVCNSNFDLCFQQLNNKNFYILLVQNICKCIIFSFYCSLIYVQIFISISFYKQRNYKRLERLGDKQFSDAPIENDLVSEAQKSRLCFAK